VNETILLVEDEKIIACDIKECLEKSGYTVPAIIAYGEQAIEKAEQLQPDLILMDVMLKGDMNGIQAAEEIVNRFKIPVIYLTAYSDDCTLRKAKVTQPFGYILKPFEEIQLITTIEIALNKYQTERIMREALEKEKEMREIKSRFVSMLSHEFRNPLSTIFTSSELLASHSHQLNEVKKTEYINHIQNAVKHLDNLLTDVLLIGKAEVDKIQCSPAPLDLENFCRSLVEDIEVTASSKHKIIFTVQGQWRKLVDTYGRNSLPALDKKLLYHILSNLLSNAIKYSPNGGIVHFDLFYVQREVIFRIQDEGIGIPETDQESLFTSFHRASNVNTIPGNGLGLSIVKHYVDLHGGEITCASKVGVGTTFIVSIPIG
jgi:signal transduction histidine kinase